jgi:GNAT superfamily N-acetyltransferase
MLVTARSTVKLEACRLDADVGINYRECDFADGSLRPVIDRVLAFEEAAQAQALVEAGEHVGKVVLSLQREWPASQLLVAVRDAAAGEVIGGQLDGDPVTGQDADVVLAHLAGDVTEHHVAVVEPHTEHGVGQGLLNDAFELQRRLFRRAGPRLPFRSRLGVHRPP